MLVFSLFFLHALSCEFAGEFLCTASCLQLDGSIDVVLGEFVSIAEAPNTTIMNTTSLYNLTVTKGNLHVTEHCAALGEILTCATTNISFSGQFKEDLPNPLIQKLIFEEDCKSFTKVVREFDTKNICQLQCNRNGNVRHEANLPAWTTDDFVGGDGKLNLDVILTRANDDFTCSSIFLHPDQTITKSKTPYQNILSQVDGSNGQFTEYENIATGFHENGHCALLSNQESLCLTTNISVQDDPEIVSKSVFTTKDSYTKYVRSVANNSLFVGRVDCSAASDDTTFQMPQCDVTGKYDCSGFCILADASTVSAPEFAIVEEVTPGLFYNISSGRGSSVHDSIMCVLDESAVFPALSCVMIKKSGEDGRIVAFEEVVFDENCESMTRIVRDLLDKSYPVCEFRCDKY